MLAGLPRPAEMPLRDLLNIAYVLACEGLDAAGRTALDAQMLDQGPLLGKTPGERIAATWGEGPDAEAGLAGMLSLGGRVDGR